MEIVLLLLIILVILFMFSINEFFEGDTECAKIQEGECSSKLCPSKCKIQHLTNSDKCYCVERK
jgi:hypothetical protein